MKISRLNSILLFFCYLPVFSSFVPAHSEEAGPYAQLNQLFTNAVTANGKEYFELRERILEFGEKAKPFLLSQSTNEDLCTRVVARASLSWISEREINLERTKLMVGLVNYAQMMHGGPAPTVAGIAYYNRTNDRMFDKSSAMVNYEESASFLMEVAMRGLNPDLNECKEYFGTADEFRIKRLNLDDNKNQEIARAGAAALMAGMDDNDVVSVLQTLYETGGRTMRRVAAIGLKKAGKETDEPNELPRWWW